MTHVLDKKATRGARRSDRAHEAVLAAAAAVAAEHGYAGASIEGIAGAAGVGKQTIYRWWPSKAALFVEVYGRLVPADRPVDDAGSLDGDLRALLRRLDRAYFETPAARILSGLIAEAQSDAGVAAHLRERHVAPRRAIVADLLRRAEARGEIRPAGDVGFVSDLFSAAVWFRLLFGDGRLDDAFAARLVALLLDGVRRAPAELGGRTSTP